MHPRKKRMQELSTINASSVFNQVYYLQKPDYSRDVTEASSKAYVLVLLTSSQGTNVESRIMTEIWRELAKRFGDVKFCQMRADLCIEGYPDKNTPTVLVYKDGDIKKQLVTLRELQGTRTTTQGEFLEACSAPISWFVLDRRVTASVAQCSPHVIRHYPLPSDPLSSDIAGVVADVWTVTDFEKVLVDIGAVRIGDSRLHSNKLGESADTSSSKIRQSISGIDPDDSDWD